VWPQAKLDARDYDSRDDERHGNGTSQPVPVKTVEQQTFRETL
jgi:hypothetical protein